jgi:LPS sulfotransferase NodH
MCVSDSDEDRRSLHLEVACMPGYGSARYDLPRCAEVGKVFVIASAYRAGSTMLATTLWEKGTFGAPWDYFNFESREMDIMMARIGAKSLDEYVAKLFQLRVSPNGVFGTKTHFHHFESVLQQSKELRRRLAGARYIYVNRRDKIAEAISMAKALQTNSWTSFASARRVPLFYSHEFISDCLREVMRQTEDWWRWFGSCAIEPYVVEYEEFIADVPAGVDGIARWLNIDVRSGAEVVLPKVERQSDGVNREWQERFLAETKAGFEFTR